MAIPHPRDVQLAVVNWLDERYPFTKAIDEAMYQRVPNFANAFYYCFGGMVFVLIVLQLLTGILLAIYYVPDARGTPQPAAYTSVLFIQNNVYLGWLIRGVHFWCANILILMVLLHKARARRSLRRKRSRSSSSMVTAATLSNPSGSACRSALITSSTRCWSGLLFSPS